MSRLQPQCYIGITATFDICRFTKYWVRLEAGTIRVTKGRGLEEEESGAAEVEAEAEAEAEGYAGADAGVVEPETEPEF